MGFVGQSRPYENFDLKTKIWSKSSIEQKNVFGREESKERKLGFCTRNQKRFVQELARLFKEKARARVSK